MTAVRSPARNVSCATGEPPPAWREEDRRSACPCAARTGGTPVLLRFPVVLLRQVRDDQHRPRLDPVGCRQHAAVGLKNGVGTGFIAVVAAREGLEGLAVADRVTAAAGGGA